MQKSYHRSFQSLQWSIDSIKELKPQVVVIEFHFDGLNQKGDQVQYQGIETIIASDEKIQHIDVQRI